jgi:hypothetical protein
LEKYVMKAVRILAVLIATSLFATSCGEPPSAPVVPAAVPAPQADLIGDILGGALRLTGLVKCSDLPFASAVQTIGPEGGVLSAGPHVLVIPPEALRRRTTITMTVPTGLGVNAVHFEPEGLQFRRSAALTMSYTNCDLLGRLFPKRIAYTEDNLEIKYYVNSLGGFLPGRVTGRIDHFSDYVVAW